MTRIATAAQNSLIQYYMMQNQNNLNTINTQISTGYTGQTYSQIAPQADNLVNFQAEASSQQGYITTINTLSTRLQTMQLALQQIQTQVESFREQLPNAAYQTPSTISEQAQQLLQQVAGDLNSQDGSGFIFGGTDTGGTPPVDLSNLPTGSAATLTAPVNGTPADNGYYTGGAANPAVHIDTTVTVNYSITADNASSFEPIIRVLNFLAQNGPFNQSSSTDQANLTKAGQMLDQALQSMSAQQSALGLQQSQLSNTLTAHQSQLNIAQNGISNIVSVNQATAITQLQTIETQMEASYSATSSIQKLSLVNYMG